MTTKLNDRAAPAAPASNGTGSGGPRLPQRDPASIRPRAAVGALLVCLAGLGAFLATRSGDGAPETAWVIARRPIAAGSVVDKDDLAMAPGDVPPELAAGLVVDWRNVVGKIATTGFQRNEFVHSGRLSPAGDVNGKARRITLDLARSDALGGDVRSGTPVDVVVRANNGNASVAASAAKVIAVSAPTAAGLTTGLSERVLVTVVVGDTTQATAILSAPRDGVTLISPAEAP